MSLQRRLTLWTAVISLIFAAVAMILLQTAAAKAGPSEPGERAVQAVWHNIERTEYTGGRVHWEKLDYNYKGVYCSVYDSSGQFLEGIFPEDFDTGSVELTEASLREVSTESGKVYWVYDKVLDMGIATVWYRGIISPDAMKNSMRTEIILAWILLPLGVLVCTAGVWVLSAPESADGESRPLRRAGIRLKESLSRFKQKERKNRQQRAERRANEASAPPIQETEQPEDAAEEEEKPDGADSSSDRGNI